MNYEGLKEIIGEYVNENDIYDSYIKCFRDDKIMKLYFIQMGNEGPVKIGISKNPEFRLQEIQVGNPEKLKLLWCCDLHKNSRTVECNIHKTLEEYRLAGEWFQYEGCVLRFIQETISHCFDGTWFQTNNLIWDREDCL